jgi:hypothetical protein
LEWSRSADASADAGRASEGLESRVHPYYLKTTQRSPGTFNTSSDPRRSRTPNSWNVAVGDRRTRCASRAGLFSAQALVVAFGGLAMACQGAQTRAHGSGGGTSSGGGGASSSGGGGTPNGVDSGGRRPDASAGRGAASGGADASIAASGGSGGSGASSGNDAGAKSRDGSALDGAISDGASASRHDFFSTVAIEESDSVNVTSDGDLWANCWADDDALYVANGDGQGFGQTFSDVVVSRVDGLPNDSSHPLTGTTLAYGDQVSSIWSGSNYNRKPTGMLCIHGDLYLAVEDLRTLTYDDAPAATITRSTDKGRTWSWDSTGPMFSNRVFTTIMFLDFGKDAELAPPGYVYAYGLDDNWAFNSSESPPPTQLYLARVPSDAIQDRAQWTFFGGSDTTGAPIWVADITERKPVLEDTRRLYTTPLDQSLTYQNMTVLGQGGVVFDAALGRYLYASWTEYTFELYEAPQPFGPWTHFYSKDYGVFPWTDTKNGGYALTIPSKFISADGMSMWIQSNAWGEGAQNYDFSLRQFQVTPFQPSTAENVRGGANLASGAEGAVPFVRAFHLGRAGILNDGVTTNQSEDSWTGDEKTFDFWGYTFPHQVNANVVHYTTGTMASDGGWFGQLRVQVRRGTDWVDVTHLKITPAYPNDDTTPANTTYTLSFDGVSSDGVRIAGTPGGSAHFTSIAELGVSYE